MASGAPAFRKVDLPDDRKSRRELLVFAKNDSATISIDRDDYDTVCKVFMHLGDSNYMAERKTRYSVEVTEPEGRIKKLLRVTLPPFDHNSRLHVKLLENLTSLEHLDLKHFVSLPPGIGRLQNLKELELNYFWERSGPLREIGNLINLNKLIFDFSRIESLPPSIGRLKNLKSLILVRVKNLKELPTEIGDLSNLITLSLSYSSIESLPPSIGRLKNLRYLKINGASRLKESPKEIGDLSSLTTLILENSSIGSLPSSIGRLKNLQHLGLATNLQLKELPEEIFGLSELSRLVLRNSVIASLPPSIWKMKSLRDLDLSSANISTLPEVKEDQISLNRLKLGFNSKLKLLPSIGGLKNLEFLSLSFCHAVRSLPDDFCNLTRLKGLDLTRSGVESLPDSIGCLTSLIYLYGTCFSRSDLLKLRNAVACNRARSRALGVINTDPRFWPRVLRYAPRATYCYGYHPYFDRSDEEFSDTHVAKEDILYQLLRDGRESFVMIIKNVAR